MSSVEEDEEDEEDNTTVCFYRYTKRPRGEAPCDALPPTFEDAWNSFVTHAATKRRFWQHEFSQRVYDTYLRATLQAIDPAQTADDALHAVVTKSVALGETAQLRWAPGEEWRDVGVDGVDALRRASTFVDTLMRLHAERVDARVAYDTCRAFSGTHDDE